MSTMLRFAVPMIIGDLLQQCYNIADTIIVGRFLGTNPLAAVGSAFSLMTFLTSILLGLAMGSGTVFSMRFGRKDEKGLRESVLSSFVLLAAVNAVLNIIVFAGCDLIIQVLQIPQELTGLMKEYLIVIFAGLTGIFLYNFFASLLRSLGNSKVPTIFLAVSALLNIVLDLCFVAGLDFGVAGAAWATVIAFVVSCAMASFWYLRSREMYITIRRSDYRPDARVCRGILSVGGPEALELSIMYLFNIFLNYMVIECGGTDMVGLYSTGWRVANFILIIAQSMGGAMVAVCAAEYGMRRFDMIWDAFRFSVGRSVVWTIVLSVVLALGSGLLASVFTVSDDLAYLHDETARMFLFFALFLPVMSLVYTGSSLMQSIDKASGAMVNSLARNVIMSLAFLAATVTFGTLTSLWWAMALSEILGGVMMGAHAWLVLRRTEAREGGAPSP